MALDIKRRAKYRKRVGGFSGMDVKHDESVLDISTAAECYNFDFSSGALRSGYGTEYHAAVPRNARRYGVYRYYSESAGGYVEQYVYQLANGLLRFYDRTFGDRALSGRLYNDFNMINYRLDSRDILIISSADKHLVTWDGTSITEHDDAPVISSMALHFERLFVISPDEPTKVLFSDDLDPTNWSVSQNEGGFIELLDERGKLTKVMSFANYLYVFREHGISRILASGGQNEFSVANLFISAGRIYPSSIVACGDVVMFMASDGLYVFDGYEARRVLRVLDGLMTGEPGASAYFNGRYYLSCRMDFKSGTVGCEGGEYRYNGLLVYDPKSGEYSVSRGTDIDFMCACTYGGEDFLMACDGGTAGVIARCGARFDVPLEKHWQSPVTDLGMPDKTKSVRELYVKSDCDCTVRLIGKRTKTAAVSPKRARIRCNYGGSEFAVAIDTEAADCNVRPPTLIYSAY